MKGAQISAFFSETATVLCLKFEIYTPRGYVYGIYDQVILFESKAQKQAHS